MKKVSMLIFMLFIIFVIFGLLPNKANAITEIKVATAGEIIEGASGFITEGKNNGDKIDEDNLIDMSSTLYNVFLVVGIVIAVIVGIVLGIRFIAGSVEQKAEIKALLLPYILGCVVVFGAFTIWQIIVEALKTME